MRGLVLLLLVGCTDKSSSSVDTGRAPAGTPTVEIVSPETDSTVQAGEAVSFFARVEDAEDDIGALWMRWSSDQDGLLYEAEGADQLTLDTLSAGTAHTITLQVTDTDGLTAEDTLLLTVAAPGAAPTLQIRQPTPEQLILEGEEVVLQAEVASTEVAVSSLEVRITSDRPEDGALCHLFAGEDGLATCAVRFSPGALILTFTVIDEADRTDSAQASLEVIRLVEHDGDGDGYAEVEGDCDDTDSLVSPEGEEVENGVDDNCDGTIDEGTAAYDDDGDGYTEHEGDCDDGDAALNPGVEEVCGNTVDEDCSGSTNDEDAIDCLVFYQDSDEDGYGSTDLRCLCEPEDDYTADNTDDCLDASGLVSPDQTAFFTSDRGDGSYDYNCDGVEEQELTAGGSCPFTGSCVVTPGWSSGAPVCGAYGSYITGCYTSYGFCIPSTSTVQQSCR